MPWVGANWNNSFGGMEDLPVKNFPVEYQIGPYGMPLYVVTEFLAVSTYVQLCAQSSSMVRFHIGRSCLSLPVHVVCTVIDMQPTRDVLDYGSCHAFAH